jgi:uncharacterized small protein (DUF1192 family)
MPLSRLVPSKATATEAAMTWEADEPRKPSQIAIGDVLDDVSIPELQLYLAQLEAEMARVRDEIIRKDAHKRAAMAAFKTPDR